MALRPDKKCVVIKEEHDIDTMNFLDITSEFDAFCRKHGVTYEDATIDLESDYDSSYVHCTFMTRRYPTRAEMDEQARLDREAKERKLAEDRRTIESILKRQPQLKMEYLLEE